MAAARSQASGQLALTIKTRDAHKEEAIGLAGEMLDSLDRIRQSMDENILGDHLRIQVVDL